MLIKLVGKGFFTKVEKFVTISMLMVVTGPHVHTVIFVKNVKGKAMARMFVSLLQAPPLMNSQKMSLKNQKQKYQAD